MTGSSRKKASKNDENDENVNENQAGLNSNAKNMETIKAGDLSHAGFEFLKTLRTHLYYRIIKERGN